MMFIPNVILQDEFIALEPMALEHCNALYRVGADPSIWQWTSHNYCASFNTTKTWIETCLINQELGVQLPFVIVDKVRHEVVGSTSFLNISQSHKTIEIGYTFLRPSAQKSHVNRHCKLLLLSQAFEVLECNRVAFQTHEKNHQSRTAILGIGAKFEGIQRYARIQQDGSIRNSAVYSIVRPEWTAVKASLVDKLAKKENNYVCT